MAKTPRGFHFARMNFEGQRVSKFYVCLVHGLLMQQQQVQQQQQQQEEQQQAGGPHERCSKGPQIESLRLLRGLEGFWGVSAPINTLKGPLPHNAIFSACDARGKVRPEGPFVAAAASAAAAAAAAEGVSFSGVCLLLSSCSHPRLLCGRCCTSKEKVRSPQGQPLVKRDTFGCSSSCLSVRPMGWVAATGGPAAAVRVDVAMGVSSGRQYSLVLAKLLTGRTHQIRVHLAAMGHPLVMDYKYHPGQQQQQQQQQQGCLHPTLF